ncbi:hypothetical protein KC318_g7597 [Hortaea werneckii]|nr:hypothetical protein KC334_g7771 [Hortaea werneckii]KAI7006663.1 hypothetical protein KC355_g7652 [Hortaea werneckii]KAI7153153.1 hypothetical protein KC324_g14665 [Hortaea werneckii]KAI7546335.1 hypothetical protein KC316_g14770 [Hortaea werneckii]KAI7664666.1 hypothetical protein KC318_g7597 [Hortaea werneckii]
MNVLKTYLSPTRISQPAAPRGKAALLAPGQGYDTSTQITFDQNHPKGSSSWVSKVTEHVVLRLTRWDAIYFASSSWRGYLYEQEWAFSWVFSRLSSKAANAFLWPLPCSEIVRHALSGICLSHLSHFLAVIVLYHLIHSLIPSATLESKRQVAFAAACLHVFSPAGLFLSAPYAESTFAALSFLGCYCYVKAIENRYHRFADAYQLDACWTVAAGLSFGLATTMRTNGLLNGIIFAWDVYTILPRLPHILRTRDGEGITRLFATLTAGGLIAIGFTLPQIVAYTEYCTNGNTRPWCTALPPSIYSFVQKEYWNVGLFRYWTLNNLPLFLLAAPLGYLMIFTALSALLRTEGLYTCLTDKKVSETQNPHTIEREKRIFMHVLPRIAVPQLILVVMAGTSFHVQILNRISSGYVVWYFMLAVWIYLESDGPETVVEGPAKDEAGATTVEKKKQFAGSMVGSSFAQRLRPEWLFRAMVMYALVQGGLYACFLPPA